METDLEIFEELVNDIIVSFTGADISDHQYVCWFLVTNQNILLF